LYKKLKMLLFILPVLVLVGCGMKKEVRFTGRTMGTTYHITVISGYFNAPSRLDNKIAQRLEEINQSMSTYLPDSEISRFNGLGQTDESVKMSSDFLHVMIMARDLFGMTAGCWDGTVKPLVDLWGFSKPEMQQTIPAGDKIKQTVERVGFEQIQMDAEGGLSKKNVNLALDLGSIAKGYAVDQVAELIRAGGWTDFLVEVGGEVYASGVRKDGQQWKVGVNLPDKNAAYSQVYKVVTLKDSALATSGDYRNFFEVGKKRYSHVIDPRNGYPVDNGVVSVSVITDTCTLADGLATAIMVMGRGKGLELVNRLEGVECLIIIKGPDGGLTDYYSTEFKSKVEI
jgi:thiamine biosynthesis lipoprotein